MTANDGIRVMRKQTLRTTFRTVPGCIAAALLFCAAMPQPAAAQEVVVMVNGLPITNYDIDQRTKFDELSQHKRPSRKEVIDELIDDKLKIHEAALYSMSATDAQVDSAISSLAQGGGLNVKQFTEMLASHGVGISTVKSKFKATISWNQLVRGRFPATLQIEESEIRSALASKGAADAVAYDYTLRPILFVVPKGSPQSVIDGRMREAEGLRTRFEGCDSGLALARALRDVAIRDPVRRSSADLAPELSEILNNTPVGKLTKPEVTAQGVELFALCARSENKNDTPQRRATQQELFKSRFEARSKRYLDEVRRSAMIEYK